MDPTCGLADKIRDLVLDQIWKQLLYLVHYHRNIEQLNGQFDDLNRERSSLQHRIDEAKNNVEQIEEKVLHWLGEVDELSKQVQKFQEEESQAKTECSITSCPNPWLRYKLSKRAETIAQEAKNYGKRSFDRVSYRAPPGLWGLGGVGKTTIAKDIEKEEKNHKIDGNYGIRFDDFNRAHHEVATKNVSNKTFKSLFNSKVLLPKLEILELSNLLNKLTPLIWDDQLSHNSFNNLKVLVVKSCGFVKLGAFMC
ncbi:hypothetical protein K1719_044953 [Acacia pycnantha]|nr:hypothetical protein K1719_044953 [Acacia pycnantha]